MGSPGAEKRGTRSPLPPLPQGDTSLYSGPSPQPPHSPPRAAPPVERPTQRALEEMYAKVRRLNSHSRSFAFFLFTIYLIVFPKMIECHKLTNECQWKREGNSLWKPVFIDTIRSFILFLFTICSHLNFEAIGFLKYEQSWARFSNSPSLPVPWGVVQFQQCCDKRYPLNDHMETLSQYHHRCNLPLW